MYSKINNKAIRNIIISVLGAILMTTVVVALAPKIEAFAETITTSSETKVVKSTSESSEVSSESSSSTETSSSSSVEESEVAESSSTEEVQEPEDAYVEEAPVEASTVDTTASTVTTVASSTDSYVAPNGNTAGAIGSAAAAQMAAATGVPQSTWEAIIARESNGDPNVANASGASGLFQTMPGWGSTATVEDQIATAITVYNTQGLSAWGY